MRFLEVLFTVALLWSITALQPFSASAHGCAPPAPSPVSSTPTPAPANQGVVLLNEVLLDPQSTWNCSESGTSSLIKDSWVELYNPKDQAFDLYAARAYIDSGLNTTAYYLPFSAAIAAHGFLVLFPRIEIGFSATETSTLRLMIGAVTIDQVQVPQLAGDQSYARIPDGANMWQVTDTPTIDASNNVSQTTSSPTPTPQATSSSTPQTTSSPTPYATSLPPPHATPTSTSHGHRGHGNSKGPPLVTGTQPAWGNLGLPAHASTPTGNLSSHKLPALSSSPRTTSDSMALPRQIALTLLAVSLALTLLWCWRLFKPR